MSELTEIQNVITFIAPFAVTLLVPFLTGVMTSKAAKQTVAMVLAVGGGIAAEVAKGGLGAIDLETLPMRIVAIVTAAHYLYKAIEAATGAKLGEQSVFIPDRGIGAQRPPLGPLEG